MVPQFIGEGVAGVHTGRKNNERFWHLAFQVISYADNRSLGHRVVCNQRAFDCHRPEPMTGNV